MEIRTAQSQRVPSQSTNLKLIRKGNCDRQSARNEERMMVEEEDEEMVEVVEDVIEEVVVAMVEVEVAVIIVVIHLASGQLQQKQKRHLRLEKTANPKESLKED